MATILIFLGVLIFCAHLFESLFSKKRIPDVLLLLVLGLLIGPVFGLVHPDDFGNMASIFSSLTLIFILLDVGIDLSIDSLKRYWKGVVQVTLLSFVVCMAITGIICYFMGFDFMIGLMIGAIVAGTGPSIVIPFIRQMRVSEYTRTVLTMESAVSEVISIVVAMSIMDTYQIGSVSLIGALGNLLASLTMAAIIGIAFGVVWSYLLTSIRKIKSSMFLTPALVFIIYGISELLGFSGAIAVLVFSIVLGNPDYFHFRFLERFKHHEAQPLEENEKSFFKELVFIFKTYFFVYIGICIPFTNMMALQYGLIITVSLFITRYLLLLVVGHNNPRNDRRVVSMMIPKGLATALLASMPEQINQAAGTIVIPGAMMIKYVAYAVIFFSIVGTSLLVFLTRKSLVKKDEGEADPPNEKRPRADNVRRPVSEVSTHANVMRSDAKPDDSIFISEQK
jgi:NhaP-type Na+/H+ or K+/H+ antiporter